jgi:large subunit ribosomal protein L10
VDRSEKQQLVTSLHQTLKTAELVVITQQSGLTVAEATNLRRQMRQAGAGFKVTKNRLARLALEGTKF